MTSWGHCTVCYPIIQLFQSKTRTLEQNRSCGQWSTTWLQSGVHCKSPGQLKTHIICMSCPNYKMVWIECAVNLLWCTLECTHVIHVKGHAHTNAHLWYNLQSWFYACLPSIRQDKLITFKQNFHHGHGSSDLRTFIPMAGVGLKIEQCKHGVESVQKYIMGQFLKLCCKTIHM